MDRKSFLASAGAAAGMAALGSRTVGAAKAGDEDLRNLGKTDLKIALQPHMFRKMPFLKQLEMVAYYGYPGFERLGWRIDVNGDRKSDTADLDIIRRKMDELGLTWTCITGVGRIGPGTLIKEEDHPREEQRFREAVKVAKRLNIKRILALTGNERKDISREKQTEIVIKGLKRLAPIAEKEGVTIVLEMLNVLVNHPGYFLVHTSHGVEIIKEVNSPNVKLLFDIYHQQISEGNLIRNITRNIDLIGHFHIGDNPGRKQPGTGEINYRNVFKAIWEAGYKGFLAMECGYTIPPVEVVKLMHDLTKFT